MTVMFVPKHGIKFSKIAGLAEASEVTVTYVGLGKKLGSAENTAASFQMLITAPTPTS